MAVSVPYYDRTNRATTTSHNELQRLVSSYEIQVNTTKAQVLAEQQIADSTIQKQTKTIRDLRSHVERLQVRFFSCTSSSTSRCAAQNVLKAHCLHRHTERCFCADSERDS